MARFRVSRTHDRVFLAERGAALVEFAIVLPLLVVFVVGIYDFSGAFNQRQKIAQAAQEGAILAAALPANDISSLSGTNPDSLGPVVVAVFNSLTGSGIIPVGVCNPPGATSGPAAGLTWTYQISGCSAAHPSDPLIITINRGWVCSAGTACAVAPPVAVGTVVTVSYPYHWHFNSVIQLLIPGANYTLPTTTSESAIVHTQI